MNALNSLWDGEYATIKSKTLIFVVDGFDVATIEGILKDVWTISSYKVITRAEFEKKPSEYITKHNAIFSTGNHSNAMATMNGKGVSYSQYYYVYYYPTEIETKKGKLIFEQPGCPGIFLRRWPYLMLINSTLTAESTVSTYDEIAKNPKLKDLVTRTLYIPELFEETGVWSCKADAEEGTDEALKGYKYKFEYISNDAFDANVLKGEQFYYLTAIKLDPFLMLNVTDAKTGEVIFRTKRLDKCKIDSDIESLSKAVSKQP